MCYVCVCMCIYIYTHIYIYIHIHYRYVYMYIYTLYITAEAAPNEPRVAYPSWPPSRSCIR